jgi:ACS family pantothenate transporter-like MFS transporter
MPVAIAAYFFLPDTPGTAKPSWIFTDRVRQSRPLRHDRADHIIKDLQIARERMAKAGRKPEGTPWSVKTILGFLTSWKTLLFTLIFMVQPFGSQPFQAFVFWLKAHNKKGKPPVYTIAQIVSRNLSLFLYGKY